MSKNKVTFKMPPLGPQHAKQAVNQSMAQVQNPVTREMATEKITEIVQQSGMPPSMLAKIGQLCEQAIHNKKDYSKFVDFMVKNKLETRETLKKPDYQMLASMVVIGKVAESMPDNQTPTTEKTKQMQQILGGPVQPTQGL